MNLVIQGEDVSTPDLKELHRLAHGEAIERISDNAFRITRAEEATRDAVREHCAQARLDWGFVEEGRHRESVLHDGDRTHATTACPSR